MHSGVSHILTCLSLHRGLLQTEKMYEKSQTKVYEQKEIVSGPIMLDLLRCAQIKRKNLDIGMLIEAYIPSKLHKLMVDES